MHLRMCPLYCPATYSQGLPHNPQSSVVCFARINSSKRTNRKAALDHAREHQAGIERLLQGSNAEDWKLQRDLAMTLRRTGRARSKLGEAGEEDFLRSRTLLAAISEANPQDLRRRRDVGWADLYLGQNVAGLDDPERYSEAAEFYTRGTLELAEVCAAEPGEENYRNDMVIAVSESCRVLVRLGMPQDAEKLRQEAILIIQPVVEAKPENLALGKALETLRGIVVANP